MDNQIQDKSHYTSIELCRTCGECCKGYPFIELSRSEVDAIIAATGLSSDVFAISKGRVIEEFFFQFKDNGECLFLKEVDGFYTCSIYEARPHICGTYPVSPKQKEYCNAAIENLK